MSHDLAHEAFHINVLFRTCFEVLHIILLGHLLCVMLADASVVSVTVDFVAHEDLGNVLVGMRVDAFQP